MQDLKEGDILCGIAGPFGRKTVFYYFLKKTKAGSLKVMPLDCKIVDGNDTPDMDSLHTPRFARKLKRTGEFRVTVSRHRVPLQIHTEECNHEHYEPDYLSI